MLLTFRLDTKFLDLGCDGKPYLAGGEHFGKPGDHEMTDEDGDKIFEYKMEVDQAISGSKFIFLKGNCGDWRCKENLAGKKCADPENWNDRTLTIPKDAKFQTLTFCYESCTPGLCQGNKPGADDDKAKDLVEVTFNVDMSYVGYGAKNVAHGDKSGW